MSILQTVATTLNNLHAAILVKLQVVFPTLTMDSYFFYSITLCALAALALAIYTSATKYTKDEMSERYSIGRQAGRDASNEMVMSAHSTISQLREEKLELLANLAEATANVTSTTTRLDRVVSENVALTAEIVKAHKKAKDDSRDLFREERIIASLASELEGFEAIAEKAKKIVETLD